jgi:hypothetical protein
MIQAIKNRIAEYQSNYGVKPSTLLIDNDGYEKLLADLSAAKHVTCKDGVTRVFGIVLAVEGKDSITLDVRGKGLQASVASPEEAVASCHRKKIGGR